VVEQEYALEYGTDRLQVHADAIGAGDRVLVIDDVLATGGTAAASVDLLHQLGADVVGVSVLLELVFLGGRSKLDHVAFHAVVSDGEV
jgi:adenine phosphoribosyltransferase